MIKKLLSIASFCAIFSVANAQNSYLVAEPAGPMTRQTVVETPNTNVSNEKANVITTGDTLWYFFNKHFYRNLAATNFYIFPSPNTSLVTHFGSRFNNTNPNLAVTGLEALASRSVSAPSASVTIRMYLCNVVAGLPVWPGVDSISAVVTGTAGTFIGGDFVTPKFMTGDFAVIYACIPTVAGDAARRVRQAAAARSDRSFPRLRGCGRWAGREEDGGL